MGVRVVNIMMSVYDIVLLLLSILSVVLSLSTKILASWTQDHEFSLLGEGIVKNSRIPGVQRDYHSAGECIIRISSTCMCDSLSLFYVSPPAHTRTH